MLPEGGGGSILTTGIEEQNRVRLVCLRPIRNLLKGVRRRVAELVEAKRNERCILLFLVVELPGFAGLRSVRPSFVLLRLRGAAACLSRFVKTRYAAWLE